MKIVGRIAKIFLITVLIIMLIGIGIVAGALFGFIDKTSDIDIGEFTFNLDLTSYVYYTDPHTGQEVEYEMLHDVENRVQVRISEIPQHVIDATVAIEDERFYSHIGFDPKSTLFAAYNYVFKKSAARGASTITQQLIKNITGQDQISWERKVQEIVQAVNLERKKSKSEIMELYLNTAYFGNNCNGIGAAAKTYFGKTASELTAAEGAAIIGITQYPVLYDPYINPDKNKEKQELVLMKMNELGYLSDYEYKQAVDETLYFKTREKTVQQSKQSYFVDQVIEDVLRDLQERSGLSLAMANNLLYTGGLKIYCTLDPEVQAVMDEVYRDYERFPANGDKQTESAMVILDVETAEVRGIVGGIGEKTASRTLNRATQSKRQPGSTIKPIAVYAKAINDGLITPFSVYEDKQLVYNIPGYGEWKPKNYYDGFRGAMTVTKAVEISTNPVPIQILDRMGITTSFNFLRDNLSISSLDEADKNLASLALGGLTNGVSVLELTSAYNSFAARGVYTRPRTYTRVTDQNGKIILDNTPKSNIAISEQAAYIMTDMLHKVVLYGTGVKANFSGDYTICGKTGTTDEDKDRWFVGYTPYYSAAVWIGFDTPERMSFLGGVNPTVPVWTDIMRRVHEVKALPAKSFIEPQGLASVEYCTVSGLAPTDLCRRDNKVSRSSTIKGMAQLAPCASHKTAIFDNTTNMIATQYCPPEVLEERVIISYNEKIMGECNVHTGEQPIEEGEEFNEVMDEEYQNPNDFFNEEQPTDQPIEEWEENPTEEQPTDQPIEEQTDPEVQYD